MDNHATTPTDPVVVEVMLPYFSDKFGNPSSRQHRFGWVTEEAVENSRTIIATYLSLDSKEIIFTSGATESNNLAIIGIAESYSHKGKHIVTCSTEHKSVLDTCKQLQKQGYQVTYLPVDEYGLIDLNRFQDSITASTILVSIMVANNEIGTIQDIEAIGKICKQNGILFHTDATQAVGKIQFDIQKSNVDLMSFSAHKIYGPKGIGALVVRTKKPDIKLQPQIFGGGHERGFRSGTLNVPAIVGFGKAIELCYQNMNAEQLRLLESVNKMRNSFIRELGDVYLNGHPALRLPNNLNMSFMYVDESALMMSMKDIAVSSGSACSTSQPEPSYVLKALGLNEERRHSAIRFGLGRFNTEEEVDYVIDRFIENVRALRNLSGVYKKKYSHINK
jgi:cysteine desulfurase